MNTDERESVGSPTASARNELTAWIKTLASLWNMADIRPHSLSLHSQSCKYVRWRTDRYGERKKQKEGKGLSVHIDLLPANRLCVIMLVNWSRGKLNSSFQLLGVSVSSLLWVGVNKTNEYSCQTQKHINSSQRKKYGRRPLISTLPDHQWAARKIEISILFQRRSAVADLELIRMLFGYL